MANILIFHGDDDYSIEEAADALTSAHRARPNADFNMAVYRGTETPVPEILSAAGSLPFLADQRLIVVKGLLAHLARKGGGETAKKATEQLVRALPGLPDSTTLLFTERGKLADSHAVLKAVPATSVRLFSAPRDGTDWIMKWAKAHGIAIEPSAAHALALTTNNDPRTAANELEKLHAYVNGERPVREEDVALMTPYVAEANMFEMVDAMGMGRADVAARLAHRMIEQTGDIFPLYGMIVRQFRNLLLVKEHLSTGGSRDKNVIAQALGIHPFAADKLSSQSRPFTLEQLERIYRQLLDYDVKIKTGGIDPVLAIDMLIAALGR
ncbi:MAG: DNA polymerase III subunit delta [Pleurocapsa minor GSE-CHR-MK-17-07R]|jgi:DNA polymerase-3 subunit delta|nr:DNA polymerase III subunit delta [Pleurocapsa minor GSE-CHR-MK 17-07R]